jgi:uncharacterized linocin/CFP29 family protein
VAPAEHGRLGPHAVGARRAATFEDRALLLGLGEAGIEGLLHVSPREPIELRHEPGAFLDALSSGMLTLVRSAIGGPFALVAGTESFRFLASAPTRDPLLEGGLLVSLRGDDFRVSLGQDFSVGYEAHDGRKLRLFLTESFAFHAMEPRAVVRLTGSATRSPA